MQTEQMLSKQVVKISKLAEEHQSFINKVVLLLLSLFFFELQLNGFFSCFPPFFGLFDQINELSRHDPLYGLVHLNVDTEEAFVVNHSFIDVHVIHLPVVLSFGRFCFLLGQVS